MLVMLAIAGAITIFAAGWVSARASRPIGGLVRSLPSAEPAPSRSGLEDVLDDLRVGVVVMTSAGAELYRNAAARRLAGSHAGVLLDAAIERHASRARAGQVSTETIEMYGPPRTLLVVDAHPVSDGRVVVFVEDVSERRRVDQVRTDFVANISHELKTPVGALSVLAETLEGETDPDTVGRVVARMLAEADRATRTIDDLLELSRIELGGERDIQVVSVDQIVAGALERVAELGVQSDIEVSVLDPVDVDGVRTGAIGVSGDRRQLVSAVGNLVENAVKYSSEGGTVQVRATRNGDWVEIAVIDQGIGIPQRDLGRVFERFYRVDRARSRATGGTGLGLSIVRHVATNHGGEVRVASTEGEGSTFVLRLPIGTTTATATATDGSVGGTSREGIV